MDISVDTRGTEVTLQYDLNINIENCPRNLKFYTDAEYTKPLEATRSGTGSDSDPRIAIIDKSRYVDKNEQGLFDETVYWKWDYETSPGQTISEDDLIDSEDFGKTITASIKVTGYEMLGKMAQVNSTLYDTLQDAINAVPKNNTETVVKLFRDTSEVLTISKNQNIVFDLGTYTVSNNGNLATITNNGTIKIINGNVTSSAETVSAINNQAGAQLTVSGGRITATGGRQAIYNKGGTVEINGDAYLSSVTTERATVHNLETGSLLVTGGTIVSAGNSAINNEGTMTIGIKDGNVEKKSPMLQGSTYGVNSSKNYNFYDGIVKGKNAAFNNETRIEDKEPEYGLLGGTELINGEKYKTAHLGIVTTVNFDANGGEISPNTKSVGIGDPIGELPTPEIRTGYKFLGWYTELTGGEIITSDTPAVSGTTYYAHWEQVMVAEINGTKYSTLQKAVNAVPANNIETTVKLLNDTKEKITIAANKNIVFDLQNYTIVNNGYANVIDNNGIIKITNGTIKSSADQGAINVNSGATLIMTGGNIITNGKRQAIFNDGGTVQISGTAYIKSSESSAEKKRGAVHNLNNGNMTITGGTIISEGIRAVYNASGTVTIGNKDGNIDSNSPVIQGNTTGITNEGRLNLYDGIVKAKTNLIEGNIADTEDNSERVESSEVINGATYNTMWYKTIQ